jgi:hypothetical protein
VVRRAAFSVIVFGLLLSAAEAGQTSGSFQVGVTIGGPQKRTTATAAVPTTYTWGAAAISVTQAGFEKPVRIERSDTLYWFAARRSGESYRIAVSVFTGEIVKVIPT